VFGALAASVDRHRRWPADRVPATDGAASARSLGAAPLQPSVEGECSAVSYVNTLMFLMRGAMPDKYREHLQIESVETKYSAERSCCRSVLPPTSLSNSRSRYLHTQHRNQEVLNLIRHLQEGRINPSCQ
jgi:hypothetical protein